MKAAAETEHRIRATRSPLINSFVVTADSKDSRSLKDRAAAEKKLEKEEEEAAKHKPRPTEIAKSHGNKPSKGAILDEQIQLEEVHQDALLIKYVPLFVALDHQHQILLT